MSKRRILYISPVIPSVMGNGLAMRAGMVLEALSRHADVSLLVIPLYTPATPSVPDALARLCRQVAFLSVMGPPAGSPSPRRSWRHPVRRHRAIPGPDVPFVRDSFDIVHLFRLSTLPFARPYLANSSGDQPKLHLDLDDIDSVTRRRLAELHRAQGNAAAAQMEDEQAERSTVLEDEVLHDFDRAYVCSPDDRQRLLVRSQAEICILPNAVRLPSLVPRERGDRPFTLLFVGTLGYYPNADALRFFCTGVLPALRRITDQPIRAVVVGRGASAQSVQLALQAGVHFAGAVADVGPYYQAADAAVVPVRTGGGTRIKVLEAFSYGVPVVSTTVGIEGIEANHEEHLLVADGGESFASACLRIRDDVVLAQRLADNALKLVQRAYSMEAIADAVGALLEPLPRQGSQSAAS